MSEKWTNEAVVILLTEVKKGQTQQQIADTLTKHFNRTFTRNAVKNELARLSNNIDLPIPTISSQVELEQKRITSLRDKRESKKLITELVRKEEELRAVADIKVTPQKHIIRPTEKVQREAVAFIIASDWHCEEIVKPETVNHMNEFNLTIADKRIDNFWNNSATLIKNSQMHTTIKKGVLALLGDFINGNIHEEMLENSSLRPIEAIIWVQQRIVAGIYHLLQNTDLSYTVVCHVGNHSRITDYVHCSTEQGNSLEYFMYHQIRSIFEKEPRLIFQIAEGYHSYLEVCGKMFRFHHGHAIKYRGAQAGIYMTARRAIEKWNRFINANTDIFGHFHQQKNDGGLFITNGSLIGWNTYALSNALDYEVPRQKFFLVTNKGEIVGEHPIFLD